MATRSLAGRYIDTDKSTWQAVYIHWDGYPEGVGAKLLQETLKRGADAVMTRLFGHYSWSNIIANWDNEPVNMRTDREADAMQYHPENEAPDLPYVHDDTDFAGTEYLYLYHADSAAWDTYTYSYNSNQWLLLSNTPMSSVALEEPDQTPELPPPPPRPTHYTQYHKGLWLSRPDVANRERIGMGYKYLVTSEWRSHTAFRTLEGAQRWATERGLTLPVFDADENTSGSAEITGSYRTAMYMDETAFYALKGELVRSMSNGSWTLGIVTTEDDGIRTVNDLNPNVKNRPVFDHVASNALYR